MQIPEKNNIGCGIDVRFSKQHIYLRITPSNDYIFYIKIPQYINSIQRVFCVRVRGTKLHVTVFCVRQFPPLWKYLGVIFLG